MKKFCCLILIILTAALLFTGCDRFLEVFYPAWDTTEEIQDQFLHDAAITVNLDNLDPGMADVHIAAAECWYDGTWHIDADRIVFQNSYWGTSRIEQTIALKEGADYLIVAWYDSHADGYPNAVNIIGEGIIAEAIGAGQVDGQYFFTVDEYSDPLMDINITLNSDDSLDWYVTSALVEYVTAEQN